jgi:hypothetical protein
MWNPAFPGSYVSPRRLTTSLSRLSDLTRARPRGRAPGLALWLSVAALALYLPLALRAVQITWDGVEFVDIARSLAAGQGYVLGVKAYFIGGSEVLHDGLNERAPLYPLLIAVLLRAGLGLPGAQVANAVLMAASVGLVCAIGCSLFGKRTGGLAGVLAATSPAVLANMLPIMSEALAVPLVLLGTWLVVRDVERPRSGPFALAGAALGLAYLARPETAVLAGALVLGAAVSCKAKGRFLRPMAACLLVMSLFVLPISLYSLGTRGSLLYSGKTYLYSVPRGGDVARDPYHSSIGNPAEFVLSNGEFVASTIVRQLRDYGGLVFLSDQWLLLLPAWPMVLLSLIKGRYPRAALPVLLVALVNFCLRALTWSTAVQPRYQLITMLLLLPFAVQGLSQAAGLLGRLRPRARWRLPLLDLAVLAIVLAGSQTLFREYAGRYPMPYTNDWVSARSYNGLTWAGPRSWGDDEDLPELLDWVKSNTQPDDVLAHHPDPWKFTFFTARPSVFLSDRLDADRLTRLLAEYRIAYVLLGDQGSSPPGYRDAIVALHSERVTETVLGRYHILDTRSLWRDGIASGSDSADRRKTAWTFRGSPFQHPGTESPIS